VPHKPFDEELFNQDIRQWKIGYLLDGETFRSNEGNRAAVLEVVEQLRQDGF
jgi:hypothetical protein